MKTKKVENLDRITTPDSIQIPKPSLRGMQSRWFCSWQGRRASKLLLALNDDGQDAQMTLNDWEFACTQDIQAEAFRARWALPQGGYAWRLQDDNAGRLAYQLCLMRYAGHNKIVLAGRGRACDILLQAACRPDTRCEGMLLLFPQLSEQGIPPHSPKQLAKRLAGAGTRLFIVTQDAVRTEALEPLAALLRRKGIDCALRQAEKETESLSPALRQALAAFVKEI